MNYDPVPDAHQDYKAERLARIERFSKDKDFRDITNLWRSMALERKYMNNFSWLGRPLVQFPGDVMAVQELISSIRPTLIIETGIAHGGSLILSASMLQLNGIEGRVIGIDIDIRKHNRKAIDAHPMSSFIEMVDGSSTDPAIFEQVKRMVKTTDKVMVFLDSNHTHEHVVNELNLYSALVSPRSYLVVFDTHVEDMPDSFVWNDRSWGKGNNPKTAVREWLPKNPDFEVDRAIEAQLLITSAPEGFLYRRG